MRVKRQLVRRSALTWILAAAGAHGLAPALPQATPDFSLTTSTRTVSLTAGGASASVTVTAKGLNGFTGTISVLVATLPEGVTATPGSFQLKPGGTQRVTLVAAANAAGASAVAFEGVSGTLAHVALVQVGVKVDVVTYHNDVGRTGLNPSETILTPLTVNSYGFGLQRILNVDGVVDAEPLLVSNLTVAGAVHDVLYVATEADSVYGFDPATGVQLWKASMLGPKEVPSSNRGCTQIVPEMGITATPVIDRKIGPHGAIFVVAMSYDRSGAYHQRLHALDLSTGADLPGSPAEIGGTYPGTAAYSVNGQLTFDPGVYVERSALLALNGSIYMGWASQCDRVPYTSWIMSFSESTLTQTSVLNITPNGSQGGIWMAGSGLAADADGFLYFLDGNGTFDTTLNAAGFPVHDDYGNGFLKLSATGGKLAVADYFEMSNTVSESANDTDLGSGGAMVLPDLKDSAGVTHRLALGAGKDRSIYVVSRDNLGKFNPSNNAALFEEIDGQIGGVWSSPAYFNNTVYYCAASDRVKTFPILNARLEQTPTYQSANWFPYPGATPSISSNRTRNGIVWTVENETMAVLNAYRASDLKVLYDSNMDTTGRDHFGAAGKFITPMIANGQVFVGAPGMVAVFGLLPK